MPLKKLSIFSQVLMKCECSSRAAKYANWTLQLEQRSTDETKSDKATARERPVR